MPLHGNQTSACHPWEFTSSTVDDVRRRVEDSKDVKAVLGCVEVSGHVATKRDLRTLTLSSCRYHLSKTQSLMKAYRIGRVALPWTNLTPPIARTKRADAVEKSTASTDVDSEAEWSDSTLADSAADLVTITQKKFLDEGLPSLVRLRTPDERTVGLSLSEKCSVKPSISREEYISSMEQKEIASDMLAYPSLDGETQEAISREYQALHERIIKDGFYVCRYSEYGKDSIRFAVLFAAFAFALWSKWYLTSAAFLGFFWQQIMFVAHDAGHRGITGKFVADTLIGAFVADFCCGLSIGWWKSSHNVHHLVTNSPVCLRASRFWQAKS